jgi:hypothetical protein
MINMSRISHDIVRVVPRWWTSVRRLYTLGPEHTNLHAAALFWFEQQHRQPEISLYPTLEEAIPELLDNPEGALLACAAYPRLHELIFRHVNKLDMAGCFWMPTYPMVLAQRPGRQLSVIATHTAPQDLVPESAQRRFTTSNAQAAQDCADGLADGCITTRPAALSHDLIIVRDFGPIGMAFTLHVHRSLGDRGEDA